MCFILVKYKFHSPYESHHWCFRTSWNGCEYWCTTFKDAWHFMRRVVVDHKNNKRFKTLES